MEDLPSPILVDILSRLGDSTDLARCRLVSNLLWSLSYDVRSVNLVCSHARFLRSRAPPAGAKTIPFKSSVINLASLLRNRHLESLSLGIERPFVADDDELDDSNDLHLTAVDFVSVWLPGIGGQLRSLSFSDFWGQSCWRRSEVLALISNHCEKLRHLELRNAWLSVEGLKPLSMLTSLTLEFIRLDDEDLDKVNECFPSLEVLNLIGVGGLNEPKIHLPHLKRCYWMVSNVPRSLTINAPGLIELKLRCVKPNSLILRTPLLSTLNLIIEKQIRVIEVVKLLNLKSVRIEASGLSNIVQVFISCNDVKYLEIEAPISTDSAESSETVSLGDLSRSFPNTTDLKLGPGACNELKKSFVNGGPGVGSKWISIKKLTVHIPSSELDISFISLILEMCIVLCEIVMVVPEYFPSDVQSRFMFKYGTNYPKVKWKWLPYK